MLLLLLLQRCDVLVVMRRKADWPEASRLDLAFVAVVAVAVVVVVFARTLARVPELEKKQGSHLQPYQFRTLWKQSSF